MPRLACVSKVVSLVHLWLAASWHVTCAVPRRVNLTLTCNIDSFSAYSTWSRSCGIVDTRRWRLSCSEWISGRMLCNWSKSWLRSGHAWRQVHCKPKKNNLENCTTVKIKKYFCLIFKIYSVWLLEIFVSPCTCQSGTEDELVHEVWEQLPRTFDHFLESLHNQPPSFVVWQIFLRFLKDDK